MKQKNKYVYRSHISEKKFREIIKCFVLDITADRVAKLTNINRNTINRYLMKADSRIMWRFIAFRWNCGGRWKLFWSKESERKRKRRRRKDKSVWYLLKREDGKVCTEVIPDCSRKTLQAIISGKVDIKSVINTDGWKAYNGLVDIGYGKHYRVIHSKNEFARGSSHINGIESFWSYAKHRLKKFHSTPRHTFYLHLKETEYRFNLRNSGLYAILLTEFRGRPLK